MLRGCVPARTRAALVWIVPLAAAALCIAWGIASFGSRGPTITIAFASADGLAAGQSTLRLRNVDIGRVTRVRALRGQPGVTIDVRLDADAHALAVADTRFWIVRPRIGPGGLSGLDTVLSGSYIAAALGHSREPRTTFTGLDTPPVTEEGGRHYTLRATSLGSVAIGSPVYHRRARVGQVTGYALDADGHGVLIDVFVAAPFDRTVDVDARWWQAGGLGLRLGAGGMQLDTPSLAALLGGALAFASPPGRAPGSTAPDGARFRVADDEIDAMRTPNAPAAPVVMRFDRSLRGLEIGAPVEFRGIELGNVTAVGTEYDAARGDVAMRVTMALYPDRLGQRYRDTLGNGESEAGKALLRTLVARGLRGQLRVGNPIANRSYVALDMFPNAPPTSVDTHREPIVLPTVPGTLDVLRVQMTDIAGTLSRLPLDRMGTDLNAALVNTDALFKQLDTELAPHARAALGTARQSFTAAQAMLAQQGANTSNVRRTLTQFARTSSALRALADDLEQHPDGWMPNASRATEPADAAHPANTANTANTTR
ncbi:MULTISPECIES: intermembrane transport protein PqiB [Burkholderia]|uniref:Mammalian cell entry protein n=2 Tax=Burkholderia TaxID=32008 RepID=A0ABY6XUG1_9BURK|nr:MULTISPECIES: MlaD family protein [Burkholderia]VWC83936.1 mammalian cell entry protein [Burkholderia aenigmatica]VWD52239.1 mammalian cell entry protein [Burkholderia aenigmatica]